MRAPCDRTGQAAFFPRLDVANTGVANATALLIRKFTAQHRLDHAFAPHALLFPDLLYGYRGDRLAIITNGGGPGVLATDALIALGGRLAELSAATLAQLDKVLPPTWSHGNPIDIIGDALGERYATALKVVSGDHGVDAILILNVPTALASSEEAARCIVEGTATCVLPIFTCWLGQSNADPSRTILRGARLATYSTPEDAVRAFMHTVEYHRNQTALVQIPASAPELSDRVAEVAGLIRNRLQAGPGMLSEVDSKSVLSAYAIPVVQTTIINTPDQAVEVADKIGYPVALKVVSPQITHKSDVGGVVLKIGTAEVLRTTIQDMRDRITKRRPDATIEGFALQKMLLRARAQELIVGAAVDPTFGPIILFGHGGTAVEVIGDRAVGLPPLNMRLAAELISRTQVRKLLAGYRDRPAADIEAIAAVLVRVSELMANHPEIIELDINPLLADEQGVLALDARIRLAIAKNGADRLAIRPYPRELEEMITLRDGRRLLARPIRPEDQPAHERFIASLSAEDIHSRFFGSIRKLDPSQMARLTQIDYDREMAFIALPDSADGPETVGVVRAITDPDNNRAEFAIVVRSDMKAQGLGYALMNKIIRYCRQRGTRELAGQVLTHNQSMLQLARELGFQTESDPLNSCVRVSLSLQ